VANAACENQNDDEADQNLRRRKSKYRRNIAKIIKPASATGGGLKK